MASHTNERRSFFISFNSLDRQWAEWIAAELEKAGYTTYFQPWDFRPGSNFVLEMNKAAALTDRTIAVLSPNYLAALFTQPEWAAALVADPTGANRKLIPVRVVDFQPSGLLSSIVYVDLVGLSEGDARRCLLDAVSDIRPKPDFVPYPNPENHSHPFPGSASATKNSSNAAQPSTRGEFGADASIRFYAALSAVCFLLGAGLFALMTWKIETLAKFGLTGRLFYLILIPIGLSAAGFLFGVLRSTAIYRGTRWSGTLELGGPIVAAVLVVIGGFALPLPEPGSFSLTVFVHGSGGRQDAIVRGKGSVVIDLGDNRRNEAIDRQGTAYFRGIPTTFLGEDVPASVDVEGYEVSGPKSLRLNSGIVYLPVRRKEGRLSGFVGDVRGLPIGGAEIYLEGTSTTQQILARTETNGRFSLTIPGEQMKDELVLHVGAKVTCLDFVSQS